MTAAADRHFHLWNWMDAPFHRQAFQHVREVVPTELIRNVDGPVTVLPNDPVDLDGVTFEAADGSTIAWDEHLSSSACDAVCVVHDGRIVHERYLNGMHERTPHLLMSVSKSFCGAALGTAIGRGHLAATDLVTDVAPEFAGTSLDGATVQHVIDMTAGTDFVEDYDAYLRGDPHDPLIEYEHHAGYRPLGDRTPLGTLGHFRTYGTAYPHGAWFQYRSPLTNIAARLLEVVNDLPYPEIVSRDLWRPMGMEHEANIMLDCRRHPVVEGGMSCTLRDLARFGLTYLQDGAIGGRQVIPAAWVADTFDGDDAALAAFEAQDGGNHDGWAMYRNAFWVIRQGRIATGSGIFGQSCFVHRPSRGSRRAVPARQSHTTTDLPTFASPRITDQLSTTLASSAPSIGGSCTFAPVATMTASGFSRITVFASTATLVRIRTLWLASSCVRLVTSPPNSARPGNICASRT